MSDEEKLTALSSPEQQEAAKDPADITMDILQLTEELISSSIEDLMTECTSDECDALEAFVQSVAASIIRRQLDRPGSISDLEWTAQMWRDGQ